MAGRRPRSEIVRCEVLNSKGLQCTSNLGSGWSRCLHHSWKAAEELCAELEDGAAVPLEPSRHQLLGLGLFLSSLLRAAATFQSFASASPFPFSALTLIKEKEVAAVSVYDDAYKPLLDQLSKPLVCPEHSRADCEDCRQSMDQRSVLTAPRGL